MKAMDIKWVKTRSWHAARPRDYTATSYCGRDLSADGLATSDELPGTGKSCETCLRIVQRIEEHAVKAVLDAEGIVSHDPVA